MKDDSEKEKKRDEGRTEEMVEMGKIKRVSESEREVKGVCYNGTVTIHKNKIFNQARR